MEKPTHPTNNRRLKHALTTLALFTALAALPAYVQTSSGETNSPPPTPPSWSILEDADQDGMTDVDELLWGMDPLNPEDGLSDLDGDEIDLAWEFAIGTNPAVADTDMDDWSDSEEYLLYGTDPLDALSFPLGDAPDSGGNSALGSTPETEAVLAPPIPPSLSNGDFSDVSITTWKSMTTSTEYQGKGFVWNAGAIGSWTAYAGTTVEVWDSGGEKFVELDGSPNNYGIKQPIKDAKAGRYVLAWRHSGRNTTRAGSDSYCVRVYYMNGTAEVQIAQSTEFSGFDKMAWNDNTFNFKITPEQLANAGTNPIYVAFIPTGSLNTYGTLIDKVSLLSSNCWVVLDVPKYIQTNLDDDNHNGEWDRVDMTMDVADDDLEECKFIFHSTPSFTGTVTVTLERGNKFLGYWAWDDNKKTQQKQFPLVWKVKNGKLDNPTSPTFFLEGFEHSEDWDDVKLKAVIVGSDDAMNYSEEDTETITVVETDLDVDSDNSEGITFTKGTHEEDKIEASTKADGDWKIRPGKIIMVNDGFGDDIPDWADGYEIDSSDPTTFILGDPIKFIPVILERKKPFSNNCKVAFNYSASDPAGVKIYDNGDFESHPKAYTKPNGKIRIWKKNNDAVSRNKDSVTSGGHFIPTDKDIDWKDLSDSDSVTLYVEAVGVSDNLADIPVTVEIREGVAKAKDVVNFTAVKITCEPVCGKHTNNKIINPSGIVTGTSANYEIKIEPKDVPNSSIVWGSDIAGFFSNTTNNGAIRTVEFIPASGSSDSYGKIWANVRANYYDKVELPIKVFGKSSKVHVRMFILGDGLGNYALSMFNMNELENEVQKYFVQAGITFDYQAVELLDSDEYKSYYDLKGMFNAKNLMDHHDSKKTGIEIYLVKEFDKAAGVTMPGGIVVRTLKSTFMNSSEVKKLANDVAHEIGHACGLKDIYDSNKGVSIPNDKAKITWIANDWPVAAGFNSDPSYYKRDENNIYTTMQQKVIHKLLMYGDFTTTPDATSDIPVGKVYGVNDDLVFPNGDQIKVGLIDMERSPTND